MTGAEEGFLLLTADLGNPDRRILTTPQMRTLAQRVRGSSRITQDRHLMPEDLVTMGYSLREAEHITELLEERELLEYCLHKSRQAGCVPLTWVTPGYPEVLHRRLGAEAPGCLWAKGDVSLLEGRLVALVGSRDLGEKNREFARHAGRAAGQQGFVLVSGNARGADSEAQEACLQAGGCVISVIADALDRAVPRERVLYLAENSFCACFSSQRALSRNRVIHSLGMCTLVAQAGYQKGGTWNGTRQNLKHGWSPVFCFADGSPAFRELEQLGADGIGMQQLQRLDVLTASQNSFLQDDIL